MCTKYRARHELVRHLLLFTRQGMNMTGMPWQFTEMKNRAGVIAGHLQRETVDELYDAVGLSLEAAWKTWELLWFRTRRKPFSQLLMLRSWFITFYNNNFVCILTANVHATSGVPKCALI